MSGNAPVCGGVGEQIRLDKDPVARTDEGGHRAHRGERILYGRPHPQGVVVRAPDYGYRGPQALSPVPEPQEVLEELEEPGIEGEVLGSDEEDLKKKKKSGDEDGLLDDDEEKLDFGTDDIEEEDES